MTRESSAAQNAAEAILVAAMTIRAARVRRQVYGNNPFSRHASATRLIASVYAAVR